MSQATPFAEAADFCRRYASLNDAEREAVRAAIDVGQAVELVGFAGASLPQRRTLPEIELALIAAGLAFDNCIGERRDWRIDDRDVMCAMDDLNKDVRALGEVPHIFVERVAPLVSARAAELMRQRLHRRIGAIRFADDGQPTIPQHNVFELLLQSPRLIVLLVWALEAALQMRIQRTDLRALLESIWLERWPTDSIRITTSEPRISFVVRPDKYQGDLVVQLDRQPLAGMLNRLFHRTRSQKEQQRFRTVIEGFTTAFAPLVFANVDRLTLFKRSTHEIFTWARNKPLLRA